MTIDFLVAVYLIIAAVALIYSGLMTAQAYEFRRYALSRLRHPMAAPVGRRAAIIVTCRGLDLGLSENLRSLFEQDYDDYTLILVVDHQDDPARKPIEQLRRCYPDRSSRLIVAGAARNCGQKVHNLLAATAALPKEIEYLAFADSDTRLGRSWLRQLVQHLDTPGVAAATAYRWLVPARSTLANLLLHSLDAGVATVIGPARHHFVWGGSWAIRRATFDRLHMTVAWRGALSDDLVAAQMLPYVGRVRFEPEALAPTVVDYDWPDLLSFVHRQFAMGRRYAPGFWAVATLSAVVHEGVFWMGLALIPLAVALGGWTAWAASASAVLYAMQVVRAFLRQDAAAHLLPDYTKRLAAARRFDQWLAPLAGLLGCWGLVSALFSPRIRWRGIHYRVFADGRVAVLDSTLAPAARHGLGNVDALSIDGIPSGGSPQPVGYHSAETGPGPAHTSGELPAGDRLGRARHEQRSGPTRERTEERSRSPDRTDRPGFHFPRIPPTMHIVLWDTRRGGATKDFAGGFGIGEYPGVGGPADRLIRYAMNRDRRPVALAYAHLAAIFRALGHTVEYALDRPPAADVYYFHPSLPSLPWERQAIAALNREAPACRVLAGGVVAHTLPEAFAGLNVLRIRGEVEQLFWKLDEVLEATGPTVDVGKVADLDALPAPDWSPFSPRTFRVSYDFSRFPTALVQQSRGCTLSCDYCPYIVLEKTTRFRRPELVAAEMADGIRRHGFRSFKFRDPLFGLDRRRVNELAERIRCLPQKIQFSVETRTDLLREETLRTLRAAGLTSVTFGVETPDEATLREHRRSPIRDDAQRGFIAICRELGIRTVAGFMIGFPDDTVERIDAVLGYARSLNPTFANFNIVTPYPGTEFFRQVKPRIAEFDYSRYNVYTPVLRYTHLTVGELSRLHARCFTKYYFRSRWLEAAAPVLWPHLFGWLRPGRQAESTPATLSLPQPVGDQHQRQSAGDQCHDCHDAGRQHAA